MMGHDWLPYSRAAWRCDGTAQAAVFGPVTRLIEMPIAWSTDDHPHFEFLRTAPSVLQGMMNADNVLSNWIDDFLYMKRSTDWGILTYTMHPFVIGRGHRMLMLERLQDEGAQFLTMLAAATLFDARAPLTEPASDH